MTEKMYVLRTCAADGTSRNGFKWPKRGKVEAPDWDPAPECGNGLYGALWGEGKGGLFNWSEDALWQVVRVDSELVDLKGKVKFQCGYVVFTGTQKAATDKIIKLGAKGAVIGALVVSEYKGKSISGDCGTSTSGNEGISTSGNEGISTSGDHGTSTSGNEGISTSGCEGTSNSGNKGTSTSGNEGISTSGYGGTSISGYVGISTSGCEGTSNSGYKGTSISGENGTSISGENGTSISGEYGTIQIAYWCSKTNRKKIKTGYIGEDGLKPNVAYKLDDSNEFVEAEQFAIDFGLPVVVKEVEK